MFSNVHYIGHERGDSPLFYIFLQKVISTQIHSINAWEHLRRKHSLEFRVKNPISNNIPLLLSACNKLVAVYPLSTSSKGRDSSRNGNPPARLRGVYPDYGPDGQRSTAYRFAGRRNSFIEFPNRGPLDTEYSITLLAWVKPRGTPGPIANYHPNGIGVQFWLETPRTLMARFTRRGRRGGRRRLYTVAVRSRRIRLNRWQFVGCTYDHKSGVGKLWINTYQVARKRVGRFRLATNYPIRMGVKIGNKRRYTGSISCFQVFNYALSRKAIRKRQKKCFKKRKYCLENSHLLYFIYWQSDGT